MTSALHVWSVANTLNKPFKKVRFSTIVEVAYGHDQEMHLGHVCTQLVLVMSVRNFDDCGKSHLFEGFVECVLHCSSLLENR
jgi:hypothetical protein